MADSEPASRPTVGDTDGTMEGRRARTTDETPSGVADESGDGDDSESGSTDREWNLEPWPQRRIDEAVAGLTPLQRQVTREQGTERAYTGPYWDNKKSGTYVCRVCDLPLYLSGTKFKSGTGWPSFYAPFDPEHVETEADDKYGWNRTEVHCARCKSHLGHIFDDGPEPTGKRHCINGASLEFVPEGESLPR